MSVDFNAVMSEAYSKAMQRKNMGNSIANMTSDGVSKSNSPNGGSELSVEDLANAMKTGRLKREEDNSFIATNGKAFKINKNEKDEEATVNPMTLKAQETAVQMQNKISSIQESSAIATNRQNNILRSVQRDPFAK